MQLPQEKLILEPIQKKHFINSYLLYKICHQNVSSEALRIYFLEKFCSASKLFKFWYLYIPMIYQICDIMMSIQWCIQWNFDFDF